MHSTIRRAGIVLGATSTAIVLGAGAAVAHECVNPSKQGAAGAQVVFGEDGPVWVSKGVEKRIDQGLIDMEGGEGFHGLIGFDMDGDGEADMTTWQVTPNGSIPMVAQESGPDCNGVVFIGDYFEECTGQ